MQIGRFNRMAYIFMIFYEIPCRRCVVVLIVIVIIIRPPILNSGEIQ